MDVACFRSGVHPGFSKPKLSSQNLTSSIAEALLVWLLNDHERVAVWGHVHCSSHGSLIPNLKN